MELSCYRFNIIYHPGRENIPPDAFSCSTCATSQTDSLYQLHQSPCHPGITRMSHFVRARNLPFSVEDIKRMTNFCQICCKCKPRYHQPDRSFLIKSTQPFERLNIDFKGPLPSNNKNVYFLNVIDEYSRFPFVFPCPDMTASTVIECFTQLFTVFGMPAFIHSDRGPSLVSRELLHAYLTGKGVALSHQPVMDKWRNTMEWCGKLLLWPASQRTFPSSIGRMFFLMSFIPYGHFFVLLQTRLPMNGFSISPEGLHLGTLSLPG